MKTKYSELTLNEMENIIENEVLTDGYYYLCTKYLCEQRGYKLWKENPLHCPHPFKNYDYRKCIDCEHIEHKFMYMELYYDENIYYVLLGAYMSNGSFSYPVTIYCGMPFNKNNNYQTGEMNFAFMPSNYESYERYYLLEVMKILLNVKIR